jgi:double-stranded RNA-binding protein Staufen
VFIVIVLQEQKAEPEYGEDINPISRLIQIQQAKKEREPVYSLLEERGVPRRREFVMEVSLCAWFMKKSLLFEHKETK